MSGGMRLLVPVLEIDGEVLSGSREIVAHLGERCPGPPPLPRDRARSEEVRLFCEWFDRLDRAFRRPLVGQGTPHVWRFRAG